MPSTETQPQGNPPMQKRQVVSSFLFKLCDAEARGTKVALFRRSDKVRTYQHHLAPISGSIDPKTDTTPLETAWRELKEETSLTPATVKLWRKGRPFSFQDQALGREWIIYPFAFLLRSQATSERESCSYDHHHDNNQDGSSGDGDGIVLDWEHDFYNWHDPEEVLTRLEKDGVNATVCGQVFVPRIADSLMRVYPEHRLGYYNTAGRRLTEGLQQLQNDHESGARELAAIALNILKGILEEVRPSKITNSGQGQDKWDVWWRDVRLIAWHLWTNGRESMGAAIASALLAVLADLEQLYENRYGEDDIGRVVESLIDKRMAMTKRLCESFALYVRENLWVEKEKKSLKIVTLSASSTIRESILHFLNDNTNETSIELHVLESRPLFEGVTLASSIISSIQRDDPKINVTIYPDSSAAIAARDADVLLIGADRITADGAVSNKTGSLPAILAAKHVSPQTRVLVLSEVDKVAGSDERSHAVVEDEDNDPGEVAQAWRLAGVRGADVMKGKARNVYFEWVPPSLVDAYITDEGVKSVAAIGERAAWVSRQVRRYFERL